MKIAVTIPVVLQVEKLLKMTWECLDKLSVSDKFRREADASFMLTLSCNRLAWPVEEIRSEAARRTGLRPHVVYVINEGDKGVAGGWNAGIRRGLEWGADFLVCLANDTEAEPRCLENLICFKHGQLENIDIWSATANNDNVKRDPQGTGEGCDFSFFCLTPKTIEKHGWFDENFRPCISPDTLVLCADLTWRQAGDLKVGDELVGVEEYPEAKGSSRSYVKSTVAAVRSLRAPTVRITLEDGRSVICSYNHRWLSKKPTPSGIQWKWRTTEELKEGFRLNVPLDTWKTPLDYDTGWMAGIYDGEGCIHYHEKMRGLSFAQRPGAVLEKALRYLRSSGFPHTVHYRQDGIATVEINQRRYYFSALGSVRPVRLLKEQAWTNLRIRSRSKEQDKRIIKIEKTNDTEVVDLCTTSKTFIANGIVSHNSYFEDNDYAARVVLGGGHHRYVYGAGFYHKLSQTIRHDAEMAHHVNYWYGINGARFVRKWGRTPVGDEATMLHEYHKTPFNSGQPLSWWGGA